MTLIESFRLLMALYRCEHCGKVSLDPVMLIDKISFQPSLIRSITQRRYAAKRKKLEARLDRDVAQLLTAVEAKDFKGKWLKGTCSHCHKKQSWMTLGDMTVCYVLGTMLMVIGVLCYMASSSDKDNTVLQVVATIMAVAALLGGVSMLVNTVKQYMRAARTCRESPVIFAESAQEMKSKAAIMPRYLTELDEQELALLNGKEPPV